jgi:hypothetical protein
MQFPKAASLRAVALGVLTCLSACSTTAAPKPESKAEAKKPQTVEERIAALPPEVRKEYTHTPLKKDPKVEAIFKPGHWVDLFDGKSLKGWKPSDFAGNSEIEFAKDYKGKPALIIPLGELLAGVNYTNPVPRTDYEVELEASRITGNDFWCGLTFPVGETHATLILGGWGGALVGISSLDGSDASENDTTEYIRFDDNVWYKVRLRVTAKKLEVWLDDTQLIDQGIENRRVHMRFGEIELSAPFGLATFQTTAAYRKVRVRRLPK